MDFVWISFSDHLFELHHNRFSGTNPLDVALHLDIRLTDQFANALLENTSGKMEKLIYFALVLCFVFSFRNQNNWHEQIAVQELADEKADPQEEVVLSGETSEYWFEHYIYQTKQLSIFGPQIVSARNKPTFIWGFAMAEDSEPGWTFAHRISYLIVIKDVETECLKTRIYSGPHGKGPAFQSTVGFQGHGFRGYFAHGLEYLGGEDEPETIGESLFLSSGDTDREFEIKKGRIFLVSKDKSTGQFKFKQLNMPLPEQKLLDTFHSGFNEGKFYNDLEQWFSDSLKAYSSQSR